MGESTLPRVNEAASFLAAFAPETAEALKRLGEAHAIAMQTGVTGGDADELRPDEERAGLLARTEVMKVALEEAVGQCGPAAAMTLRKLESARRVQFTAAALGAIASSGVIASAFIAPAATIVTGVVALTSSLTGLFAEMVVLGGKGGYDRLRDNARTLIQDEGMARATAAGIKAALATNVSASTISEMLRDGNVLFEQINRALAEVRT